MRDDKNKKKIKIRNNESQKDKIKYYSNYKKN